MFSNHQGKYDALGIVHTHTKPCSIVMDEARSHTILTSQVIDLVDGKRIKKDDIRQAMQIILEMAEETAKGKIFLIFPEGTRSKNGNKMLEFHSGTFKCATKSKCTIQPFALIDSFKVLDHNGIDTVNVQLHYLEPIPYEEYKDMNTTEIAAMVHDRVEKKIAEVELGVA